MKRNLENLQECTCSAIPNAPVVDLTITTSEVKVDHVWVQNAQYRLTKDDKEKILSESGWLVDSIIGAAQKLILHDHPHIGGLQETTQAPFDLHQGEFVQILNVGNSHWVVVSNIGCKDSVINLFDSLYTSISAHTIRTIARLVLCSASHLTIRVMDVKTQQNYSDCGILSIKPMLG